MFSGLLMLRLLCAFVCTSLELHLLKEDLLFQLDPPHVGLLRDVYHGYWFGKFCSQVAFYLTFWAHHLAHFSFNWIYYFNWIYHT